MSRDAQILIGENQDVAENEKGPKKVLKKGLNEWWKPSRGRKGMIVDNEKPEAALGRSVSAPTSPLSRFAPSRLSPGRRYAPDNHTGADAPSSPGLLDGKC